MVEIVDTIPRRGALEKVHRIRPGALDLWAWHAVGLDQEGWREVAEAQAEFNQRVKAAAEASRARGGEVVKTGVAGVVVIPNVDSGAAGDG